MVPSAGTHYRLRDLRAALLLVVAIVAGVGCHLSDREFPRRDASPAREAAAPIDGKAIDGSAPIDGISLDGAGAIDAAATIDVEALDGAAPIDAPMTIDTGTVDGPSILGG